MVVNSIAQTFRFKQTQLATSPDVERFTAENIVSQIELKDKNGKAMPIPEHKDAYSEAIFQKVIPWYGRPFPNLIGWCSLHPAQKHLLLIIGGAAISGVALLLNGENEWLKLTLVGFNTLLYLLIFAIIFRYKLHLSAKDLQAVTLPKSRYAAYVRLYMTAADLLKTTPHKIKVFLCNIYPYTFSRYILPFY